MLNNEALTWILTNLNDGERVYAGSNFHSLDDYARDYLLNFPQFNSKTEATATER